MFSGKALFALGALGDYCVQVDSCTLIIHYFKNNKEMVYKNSPL